MSKKIIRMYTFENNENTTNIIAPKNAIKDLIVLFLEVLMTLLPIFVVWTITKMINDVTFPYFDFIVDGELLWFSITLMMFLNFKDLPREGKSFDKKLISFFVTTLLLVYSGIYVFLKLVALNIISISLNSDVTCKCVIICTVISIVISAAAIITKRGAV